MSDWKPDHPPLYTLDLETEPPITDPGGEPCRKLPIWRRVKAKHLAACDDRDLTGRAETLYLLQCITGFPAVTLAELDGYDLGRAAHLVNLLLVHGPKVRIEKRVLGLWQRPSLESTQES
jgi:hypothetical protein